MAQTATVEVPDAAVPDCETFQNSMLIDEENHGEERLTQSHKAEIAFAEYVDGVRNPAADEDDGDDGGYDVRLSNGDTVDVKYTHYEDGRLLIPDYVAARCRADYYALVVIPSDEPNTAYLHGVVTAEDVKNTPTIEWTHNPCKKYEQDELRPLSELPESDKEGALVAEANAHVQ